MSRECTSSSGRRGHQAGNPRTCGRVPAANSVGIEAGSGGGMLAAKDGRPAGKSGPRIGAFVGDNSREGGGKKP